MDSQIGLSPVLMARIAGGFYLITVVGSIYSYVIAPNTGFGHVSGLIAGHGQSCRDASSLQSAKTRKSANRLARGLF